MGTSLRRVIGVALSGVVVAGLTSVLTAPAASATDEHLSAASWSYVDSAAPTTAFLNPADELPVGARVYADGQTHVTKSYVTFDLSAYRGLPVVRAHLQGVEFRAADCTKPRTTQVWLADTQRKATWNHQPTERLQLPLSYEETGCPHVQLAWDAGDAVRQAVAAGKSKVTFALRLPDEHMSDPAYGRGYGPAMHLDVTVNHAPDQPSDLRVGEQWQNKQACGRNPIAVHFTTVQAWLRDPDSDAMTAEFEWWPVEHPGSRHRVDASARGTSPTTAWIDPAQLTEGATYAWQVRASDAYGAGPWSEVCSFTLDTTAPSAAPTVSSTGYPEATEGPGTGGTDVPGLFTFTANGVADVVGYYYRLNYTGGEVYVPAARTGGAASVQVSPPRYGPAVLEVTSVDAAGNRSPRADYAFYVAYNGPVVSCTPIDGYVGQPRTCTLAPGSAGAAEYVYTFDYSDPVTVAPGADGSASFTVTPTSPYGSPELAVHAVLPNGNDSDETRIDFGVDPGTPVIDEHPEDVVVGTPVTFTFHAVLPDSQTFGYRVDYGDPVTVPVGADGSASITLTPDHSGYLDLLVYSTNSAGVKSGEMYTDVRVDTNGPTVTSAVYPANQYGGGVGVPGTFTFRSPVPGAVSFTYQHTGEDPVTVPATADGTASIELTPTQEWGQDLLVTTTFADGTVSEQVDYYFVVAPASFAGEPDAAPLRRTAA